jgi:hypothetical protein
MVQVTTPCSTKVLDEFCSAHAIELMTGDAVAEWILQSLADLKKETRIRLEIDMVPMIVA